MVFFLAGVRRRGWVLNIFPQLHVHMSRNAYVCGQFFPPTFMQVQAGFSLLVPGLHNICLYQLSHLWFWTCYPLALTSKWWDYRYVPPCLTLVVCSLLFGTEGGTQGLMHVWHTELHPTLGSESQDDRGGMCHRTQPVLYYLILVLFLQ